MDAIVWNLISFNKLSTIGKSYLLLIIKGPTTQGNLISEAFLKLMKCSFSTMRFFLTNSNAKLLGLIKLGKINGSEKYIYFDESTLF